MPITVSLKLIFKKQEIIDNIISLRIDKSLQVYGYDTYSSMLASMIIKPGEKLQLISQTDYSLDGKELDNNNLELYSNILNKLIPSTSVAKLYKKIKTTLPQTLSPAIQSQNLLISIFQQ